MKRLISHCSSIPELLQELVTKPAHHVTGLIICSSRDDFLQQLVPSLQQGHQQRSRAAEPYEVPSSQGDEAVIQSEEPTSEQPVSHHPLLTPTLSQLAATQKIRLAYCPTIDTLRAYLATLPPLPAVARGGQPTSEITLILLNAIALHHSTSEFSAQGLSRTLALAVSAAGARWSASCVRLVECADVHDETSPAHGSRLWDAQVPLLSGSVRLAGDGAAWAGGRLISVRRVAARWFTFDARPED